MSNKGLSKDIQQEAINAFAQAGGNMSEAARNLGMSRQTLMNRVDAAKRNGVAPLVTEPGWTWPKERPLSIDTGTVVVFSDAHYQPGEPSLAHKALLSVIKDTKPRAVIANGDIFDGGSIGRHPPFGWNTRPTPVDELHACQERMGDIEQAVPKGCELVFTVGNHDIRWERTLATQAQEFRDLFGMRLEHHFSSWDIAWCAPINWSGGHPVMVKHRYANGIHAAFNNSTKSGVTIVTGHTHCLEVKPIADYRGRRWGIQCGSLADLEGPAFEYTEQNPSHACSGFAVLTFRDGLLKPPELAEVIDGKCWFRGEIVA